MSSPDEACVVFTAEALLPDAWSHFLRDGPVRVFNPGLLRDGSGWLYAYRVVGPDGLRRIGLCRLSAGWKVVPGSQLAWSDGVRFRAGVEYPEVARKWFADPRLYRLAGRLFLYWNSGWHEPHNCQFVQEMDATTFKPIGHARELCLRGPRQKLEKNWTFFGAESENAHAVYSVNPHRVLAFSITGEGDIVFEDLAQTEWKIDDYPPSHGGLRGGAPPVFAEGRYWSFCHTVHDGEHGYRYAAAAYCFSPVAPFTPIAGPAKPLVIAPHFGNVRRYPRLNPAVDEIIYPCGAAHDGARWFISHGINDEQCAVSTVSHASVLATLKRGASAT